MDTLEFDIPSERDQLLQPRPGKYHVKKVFNMRDAQDFIQGSLPTLKEKGSGFILDHFDEFFSVLVHSSNLKLSVHILGFERILKCLDRFVSELEKEFEKNQDPSMEKKPQLVTLAKMLAYVLWRFVRHIEAAETDDGTQVQSKRKKSSSKSDAHGKWYDLIDRTLVLLYHWVNLPLEKLWQPPIADKSFIMCVADICYRVLERCKSVKDKPLRESIFQILAVLVKRYNHSISCVIKIVQLVKMCDGLAQYLAAGIVELIEETQSTGIVKEILREVDKAAPEEGGTRNIGNFLEAIASSKPELILPAIGNLTNHLENQCYLMRQCAIGIIGILVREVLTGEDLDEEKKAQRDNCLENLMIHLRDTNTFVRSKTVQVWQFLCSEGAVPLVNQNALLEAIIHRLNDKSSVIRKYAYHVLKTLLQCNPFAGKFNDEELKAKLTEAKQQLRVLKVKLASASKPDAKIRRDMWKTLGPMIQETISNIPEEEYSRTNHEEIDNLPSAFEQIRQKLLTKNIREALDMILKVNAHLPESTHLQDKTAEEREDYLISVLCKIFLESEEPGFVIEDQDGDQNDRMNEIDQQREKRKEEYNTQATVVEYIKNCSIFANELAKAVQKAEIQLCSATASDAIEACSFLVLAYQFKVRGAKEAVRKAITQVYYPDPAVVDNLAEMYRQLYIGDDEQYSSDRQKALVIVKTLVGILKNLEPGESPALSYLITTWREKQVIDREVLQVMWEIYSLKLPGATPEDSRSAIMLLTMVASKEPKILKDNFDVLVTVGLGPRAQTDLLLARDTCRAMTKVQVQSTEPLKCPMRLANDHESFVKLLSLLKEKFSDVNECCYASFATDAVNAIYHLADKPDILMQNVLQDLTKHFRPAPGTSNNKLMSSSQLTNLFHIVGHCAIRQVVHLDIHVFKELKRRNTVTEMASQKKKGRLHNISSCSSFRKSIRSNETPPSASRMRRPRTSTIEDNGEEALEGATADDADAELIHSVLEHEVVTGAGLLTKFVPLILVVCQHPEQYVLENLQAAATLALSKMMTVSSIFCNKHLQLLITIMEKSAHSSIRALVLVGLTDLMNRFPNEVEPWSKHIYGRLRDESAHVRRTCVKMLSDLIMKEMVRVKGQVSELAICLVDSEEDIRQETTQFFNELANKGNALYNIMPDILSRLISPDLNLEEDKFQQIIGFILGLVQKEKQVDSIIEKVCVRFKLATSERQWRDLAYCLSLFKFNAKSIRRLTDNLILMKDQVYYDPVLKVLHKIIEQSKRKPETKAACVELEEKLEKMLVGKDDEIEKPKSQTTVMPPPASQPVRSKRSRKTRAR